MVVVKTTTWSIGRASVSHTPNKNRMNRCRKAWVG